MSNALTPVVCIVAYQIALNKKKTLPGYILRDSGQKLTLCKPIKGQLKVVPYFIAQLKEA